MRNKLIQVLCFVLVLAMVFTLSGCGASEKEKLLGTWEGEVDISAVLNTSFTSTLEEEVSGFLKFDGIFATVRITFREDDTYFICLEESSVDAMVSAMKEDIAAGLEAYLVQLIAGTGMQMTIDEIMEVMDTTMEEMVDSYITEDMVENLKNLTSEGKFLAEDGKLYWSNGAEQEAENGNCDFYTMKKDTLTLTGPVGEADETAAGVYPVVLQKVS